MREKISIRVKMILMFAFLVLLAWLMRKDQFPEVRYAAKVALVLLVLYRLLTAYKEHKK